jgi:L-lactate utilization protein LutC
LRLQRSAALRQAGSVWLKNRKEEQMSAARFKQVADAARIEKVVSALNAKGFAAQSVPNAAAAKEAVLKLIPAGSEVFTFTSATLDAAGITEALNAAPYVSLRDKMYALDRNTQSAEMRAIGSAPAYAAGSVHAVTEDGALVIASATGSQLPAYAYGAGHVVFVVGAQKIVKDLAEATERIATYTLPLEDTRAQATYGVNSAINKTLILHGEQPGRIDVVIVAEEIGF